jgi:hypothetical protein
MGLMRSLGRAGSLALAGAAAGYYLRRRGLLGGPPAMLGPPAPEAPLVPEPESSPEYAPTEEGEPETVDGVVEPAPEDEPEPDEVIDPPSAEERPDVNAVVDDLLAGGLPREGALADAVVVDETEDARLAEAVRIALAEEPGLLSAPVDIEVAGGRVTLHGELEQPDGIVAVERKAAAVEGVRALQSFLHLPGTPDPERG